MKKFLFILILLLYYNKLFSNQLEDLIGNLSLYTINENETLIDISRRYNLAFPEVMLNNPTIDDPWILEPGKVISLPTRHIYLKEKEKG